MSWQSQYGNQMLTPEIKVANAQPAVPDLGKDCTFDLEALLPMSLVREHTKTDDVPSVTDQQLNLARQSAIEAAEQYTGMLFSGIRTVRENLEIQWSARAVKRGYYTHNTKYPFATETAYMYGSRGGVSDRQLTVEVGTSSVRIPIAHCTLDVNDCCRPSCGGGVNYQMVLLYRAGFVSIDAIPAGIKTGMLKYVAWNITHPGDEIMTVRNRLSGEAGTIVGTNNCAWASGALEMWRQYVPDAI